jgi:outer membrane protein assembly factor BamB
MASSMPRLCRLLPILACLLACAAQGISAEPDRAAEALLDAAGVRGGLVVHLGCGDGDLTAALRASDRYLVHGLDTDPTNVAAARKHIASLGLSGAVSVDTFHGERLPYVDNLVNLLVAEDLGKIPMAEVRRVLAPRGVALIGGEKTVKPWPKDIDQWTHFLHDASGNAVARDRRVGPPRGVQWTAGPKRTRDHDALASLSAMTTSGGRLFTLLDEGHTSLIHRPPKWRLIARDAFSGVLLWKRRIPNWVTHLWYFRSGPAQLSRRLVSVGDRVYVTLGLDAPVSALDAATGETVRTFEGSDGTEEIVCHNDTLLAVVGKPDTLNNEAPKVFGYWELSVDREPAAEKAIAAYRASTGEALWKKTGENLARLAPLSLIAIGDRALFLDGQTLHCVRLADGKALWQAAFPTEGLFLRNYAPTVVASDGVVMCLTWNRLHAFDLADGTPLWQRKGALGFAAPGDLFVSNGLAWSIPMTAAIWRGSRRGKDGKITTGIPIPRENFIGDRATRIWGLDIRTGEVKKALPRNKVLPGGHHHRCYRNKATERFLICGRRGLEYLDLDGENHVNNWWARGVCQYGILPANGLTYVPPDPCRCFNAIKVNGFLALTTSSSLDAAPEDTQPAVERGPAYADAAKAKPADASPQTENRPARAWQPPVYPAKPDEWPTYRGNITRSSSTKSRVPAQLQPLWQAAIGGTLSAPVAAGGKLYVSSPDAQTVRCLDAETGKPLWQFVAAGRVDSPPTIAGGLCLFGCRDGSVYCLRASDGALAWRARLAPVDRRIVADSRLESPWPISGSVLVLDGAAYVAAGRSSYLDGGIRLFGLDVRTGETLHTARLATTPGPLGKNGPPRGGALPDVLVSDGSAITMRHHAFDQTLKPRGRGRTLFASTGLLEDTWFHRQTWRLGRSRATAASQAQLIAFDANTACGVMNPYTWLKRTRSMWPEGHDGHLHQKYARYTASQFPIGVRIATAPNAAPGKNRRAKKQAGEQGRKPWSMDPPIQPRAMVLADQTLFLAGWRDAVAVEERTGRPLDSAEPDPRPAFLRALSAADGKTLAEVPLDGEPVFDGLIAAYGKLFLSMKDGSVRCFAGAE